MPEAKQKPTQLNVAELIQSAKATNADAFGKINDKRAATIANVLFDELKKQLASTETGIVNVRGLGKFIIAQKTVTKDGEEKTRRKVAFRASKK